MNNLTIIIMTLYFYFSKPASSSSSKLFLNNRVSLYDGPESNILGNFFNDFKRAYLRVQKPRHMTIVGATSDEIRGAQTLLDSYACIVCENTSECGYTRRFSRGSFVIIFLEDLTKPAFERNLKVISRCKKCRVLFVSKGIVSAEEIRHLFKWSLQRNVAYAEYAHLTNESVELYSEIIGTNCTMEIQLTDVWSPGVRLDKIASWAFRLHDFNSCPVTVSSLTFRPKMMIREDENGSLTIAGGREGEMLLAIARQLNFKLDLQYPSVVDRMNFSRKMSIINDVVSGTAEIGIGRLRATNSLRRQLAVSIPYDEECVTWIVPELITWPNDIISIEFSWQVWVWVYTLFVVICLIGYVNQRFMNSKNDGKRSKKIGLIAIIIDAILLHLGNPVVHVPTSRGGRLMLMMCLFYATVLTTAYKSSLASIMATDVGVPKISNAEDIIKGNFVVRGSLYDYNILLDQKNDSAVNLKLLDRFVIDNDDYESWRKLKYTRNFVFIGRRSSMDSQKRESIKAKEVITFDGLKDCVLNYHVVMIFGKSSFLREPTDRIIRQLSESGILNYWDLHEMNAHAISKHKTAEKKFNKGTSHKFSHIYNLYVCCIGFSIAIFFVEIFTAWILPSRKKLANRCVRVQKKKMHSIEFLERDTSFS